MPRVGYYPAPKESYNSLKISNLIDHIKKFHYCSLTVSWGNGASIGIIIDPREEPHIILNYLWNGESKNYRVNLVSIPSNLNNGRVWYFVCPTTGKRCRKLYCHNGIFKHQRALSGVMYNSQLRSKKTRMLETLFEDHFKEGEYYQKLYRKNFKKFYNGKPTKKYIKLSEGIKRAQNITVEDIERLYLI
jgi:hypothetical protein